MLDEEEKGCASLVSRPMHDPVETDKGDVPIMEGVLPIMEYAKSIIYGIYLLCLCHYHMFKEVYSHITLSFIYIRTSISRQNDREFPPEIIAQ